MNVSHEYRLFLRNARDTLIRSYKYSRSHENTPNATVDLLIDALGQEDAAEIVAALILCKGKWDARISSSSRAWAVETCSHTETDLDTVPGFYYCDAVHPTRMDQIAQVFLHSGK